MNYEKIVEHIHGKGIEPYDQTEQGIKTRIDIRNGVCRALCILWLGAKSRKKKFWEKKSSIENSILREADLMSKAIRLQEEYEAVIKSRYVIDGATEAAMLENKLVVDMDHMTASAQWGFASEEPVSEPMKIAEKVLQSESRFFILSIKGDDGAHSIAICRPDKLISKSKEVSLFDPNIGEFAVIGQDGLVELLVAIQQYGYTGMDLNKSYVLWSFRRD